MKYVTTLIEGHSYELANVDNGNQQLNFIKKELAAEGGIELKTVMDGTTNEAVLECMIDRLTILDGRLESHFTKSAIEHIKLALADLEARTADRTERNVVGTNEA